MQIKKACLFFLCLMMVAMTCASKPLVVSGQENYGNTTSRLALEQDERYHHSLEKALLHSNNQNVSTTTTGTVRYATANGVISGSCDSWDNACKLWYALDNASSGDEIWVAAGIHKPTIGTYRGATFQLVSGVEVYGGFAGDETERSQRSSNTSPSVLSCDIGVQGISTDNCYHVVTGSGTDTTALLDNFTIRDGYANGTTYFGDPRGGGMFIYTGSPRLTNLVFIDNYAQTGGGGIYITHSSTPTLLNITLTGNTTSGNGGGIYVYSSTPSLTNITITENSASNRGGGIYNSSSSPLISNTIFWANSAGTGAQLNNFDSSSQPVIEYSIIQGDCPNYSICTGIITEDPVLGTLDYNGGSTPTIPLLSNSSAIDTGDDTVCPETDQRDAVRPQDGDGDGIAHCDIGAYEVSDTTAPTVTINQASGQPDPTHISPIEFDVLFSEPVTGFDENDVSISGITGTPGVSVSGSGDTYTVSVTGMVNGETVTAIILADGAQDATGNTNEASTSTDNSVTYMLLCFSLTTDASPEAGGIVNIQTAPNCEGTKYIDGSEVILEAQASSEYLFDAWSGDTSGTTAVTTITMDADKSVTAIFAIRTTLDQTILRSPGADAIVYGGRPTFKWYPVDGATVYDIELYGLSDELLGSWVKGTGACDPGPYCEYRIPFDLSAAYGTYDWRVRARNTDLSINGEWSTMRSFVYTQLERTWQISPADGFTTASTTPTFEWGEITGATMYLFNVRLPDDTFVANILVSDATFCTDGGSCVWTIPDGTLDPGVTYKWHVRAKNGRNFGRWTAYRTIVITE